MSVPYELPLNENQLRYLLAEGRDWIWSHGVLVRKRDKTNEVAHAPFCLLPTPFISDRFYEACQVQKDINLLIHKAAFDYNFLKDTLERVIKVDDFTMKLWDIYETVRKEGVAQPMSLGLLRADYMLDACSRGGLRQVEVNTIASGMGGLGSYVANYARDVLNRMDVDTDKYCPPVNEAVDGLANGFVAAVEEYNQQFSTTGTVVLFLVLDPEWNIYDQRAMQYATEKLFQSRRSGQKTHKKDLIIRRTPNDMHRAELRDNKALYIDGMEISVIYFRSLYGPQNYPTDKEWELRLKMERSRAIKCPSIHYHLAGSKKIQQALALPGVVENFIKDKDSISRIRSTFAGLYPLDHNEAGETNVKMVLKSPEMFVLKPQREGGGNNLFGRDIPPVLEAMRNSEERTAWIAMDKLCAVTSKNYMVRFDDDVSIQDVNSELGIFGAILGDEDKVKLNQYCGYLLRTKAAEASEGGTAIGTGALDSPLLVDKLPLSCPSDCGCDNNSCCDC